MTAESRGDAPGDEDPQTGAGKWWGWFAALQRILRNPGLRCEAGWVLVNKGGEFVLLLGLIKILTNKLGTAGYGEYNLAEAAVTLLVNFATTPMHQAYMRDYHGAAGRGELRAATVLLLRWFAAVTLGVAVTAAVVSNWIGVRFEFGPWTAMAAGLVFAFDRWRWLGQDLLNIQRKRRAWALYNLAYYVFQIAAITATVTFISNTATSALLAYAVAAALFGLMVTGPQVRDLLRLPTDRPSRLMPLVVSFGVPFATLLLFQWIQSFGDRYLVKALLDPMTVGVYVAAYQVCGIPFMLVFRVLFNLLLPFAYERGRDAANPAHLWAADKLLIAGILFQLAVGFAMVGLYALVGKRLLVLLTSDEFVLPTATLVVLAGARFAQSVSEMMQPIFAVHQRVAVLLWFRVLGATMTLGICWVMIQSHGTFGAAVGTCVSLCLYVVALAFAPRGCWWLVTDARRQWRRGIS